ncbi:uncharacterized protein LOC144139448 [Haemaphysalis longicornis]
MRHNEMESSRHGRPRPDAVGLGSEEEDSRIPFSQRGNVDVPRTTTCLYCKKIVKVSNMQRHLQACSKRQVALESTDLTKDAKRGTEKARNVTFLMQAGVVREMVTIDSRNANINSLKEVACNMILTKLTQHGLSRLQERLILFRHDYSNANILLPVTSAADVTEGCLVEVVISGKYKRCKPRFEMCEVIGRSGNKTTRKIIKAHKI